MESFSPRTKTWVCASIQGGSAARAVEATATDDAMNARRASIGRKLLLLDVPEHRDRTLDHAAEAIGARRRRQGVLAQMDVRAVLHGARLQLGRDLLPARQVRRAGIGVAQPLDLGVARPAEIGLVA